MSTIFYNKWAGYDWNFGIPIGNGKLGAMILGDAHTTRLQVNEDSLWYGGPIDRLNQDAHDNLPKVRELLFAGKIPEAEDLMTKSFSGVPTSCRTYSSLGNLAFYLEQMKDCTDFRRELDLNTAVYTCRKTGDDVTYLETSFADTENNVIVYKVTTEQHVPFDITAEFDRAPFYDSGFHDDKIVYSMGNLVGDNYRFCTGFTAFSSGGTQTVTGRYISCKQVTEVCFLFTATTTFYESDPLAYVRATLNFSENPYDKLLKIHTENYQKLFHNTKLTLTADESKNEIPTDERLDAFDEEHPDNGLLQTYFDFGRYLLISSSRPGSQPANLQGVWNSHMDPPWGSKYTININAEMNYWPAETLGLSECSLPLFDLMKRMCENGKRTARQMYGCRGTVAHHNTDIWGDTAPQDTWIPGTYWVMGMAWLCTHVWTHYCYTKNLEFLKEMYPVVKESVLFFHDFLVEKDGTAYICPSVSPENTYILPNGTRGCACINSTMDVEILRDLFTQYIAMSELVNEEDTEFVAFTKKLLQELPPISVGRHGQIMEWMEDYEEAEPGHRHISHLYGLFPSGQITMDETNDLAKAASVTLTRRLENGGGHTGWSRAWIMNMYAHLWDGEKCYDNIVALMKHSTLRNLLDNHPPFQIDGNFGAVAAFGEMLLQSNENRVILLPALPEAWHTGKVDGLYAYGGARFKMRWRNNLLLAFSVECMTEEYHSIIYYCEKRFKVDMAKGEIARFEIYGN